MPGSTAPTVRERFLEFRRSLPRPPRLERSTVRARGIAFAVYSTPRVPDETPLLCINGGLLYGHELLWPALSPLAGARQLILYDQRGRGLSEGPSDPLAARIEHDAADVEALRAAIGIREWDVLGHSWGGGIALLAAESDRAGTRRLVLIDSIGPTSSWIKGLHKAALGRLDPTHRAALQQQDPLALHRPDPALHGAYSRALYPAWFADRQMAQLFTPPRSISLTGAAVAARLRREGYDWSGPTRAIEADALVVHGERDLLPASVAHDLAAMIPHARLELLPDSGHMPFWEAPGPFFRAVESFLRSS